MKMENISTPMIVTISIGVLCFVILMLTYSLYVSNDNLERANKNLDHYRERYLTKQGGTAMYYSDGKWLNYNLASYDGGKNWYAFEYGDDWEVVILGTAESVYPGLLKHIDAWDNLSDYVTKNGSIDPVHDFKGRKILEDANIKVEVK